MSEKFQLHTVQNIIGYTFKNPSLLCAAFTHRSAAKKANGSNEELSFLGKTVCELLIRDYFYSNFMKLENAGVSVSDAEARVPLLMKKICDGNGLAEYMLISDSAAALRLSRTVENELFTAVAGAIYKDGGMPSVRAFVLPKLRAVMNDDEPELMREAKKEIIRKSGNERDVFSDHGSKKEKVSASSALKILFSSKKRKNESDKESQSVAGAQDSAPKTEVVTERRKQHTPVTSDTRETLSSSKIGKSVQAQNAAQGNASEPSDGNYKSALQEYVQKNIRSATVMLKYKDSRSSDGCTTEIYLFGKKVARASGANKKEASQNAAKQAYHAITASSGDAAAWFRQLKADPEGAIASHETTNEPDYVSELNRIYQKKLRRSDAAIKYESISPKGKKMMAFAVMAGEERLGTGEGRTAKEAKQNAARSALMMLGKL